MRGHYGPGRPAARWPRASLSGAAGSSRRARSRVVASVPPGPYAALISYSRRMADTIATVRNTIGPPIATIESMYPYTP